MPTSGSRSHSPLPDLSTGPCYVLLRTATYCYVLLRTATCCCLLPRLLHAASYCYVLIRAATYCYLLILTATYCYLLLRTATYCSLLPPTATHFTGLGACGSLLSPSWVTCRAIWKAAWWSAAAAAAYAQGRQSTLVRTLQFDPYSSHPDSRWSFDHTLSCDMSGFNSHPHGRRPPTSLCAFDCKHPPHEARQLPTPLASAREPYIC